MIMQYKRIPTMKLTVYILNQCSNSINNFHMHIFSICGVMVAYSSRLF